MFQLQQVSGNFLNEVEAHIYTLAHLIVRIMLLKSSQLPRIPFEAYPNVQAWFIVYLE